MTKTQLWNVALSLVRRQIGAERTDFILRMMTELADKFQTLDKIYERFCISAQNRWIFPQVIGWIEHQPDMQAALNYFNLQVNKDWNEETFYEVLTSQTQRGRSADLSRPRNLWRQFSQSLADITTFLIPFLDSNNSANEFRHFIKERSHTKDDAWQLAEEISGSIRGMRATLVCDTLKEIGFTQYSKPDLHIRNILTRLGYSQSDNDRDIFDALWDFSSEINVHPSQVDKIFWLIGSGNYYMFNEKYPPLKDEFFRSIFR